MHCDRVARRRPRGAVILGTLLLWYQSEHAVGGARGIVQRGDKFTALRPVAITLVGTTREISATLALQGWGSSELPECPVARNVDETKPIRPPRDRHDRLEWHDL
jgi:hypothetical protein